METNNTNKPVRPNPQGGRSSNNVVRPNNRPNPQGARPVRQAPIKPSSSSVDISKPQQTQQTQQTQQRQPQASQQRQQPNQQSQQTNQRQAPIQPSESEAPKKKFNYNPDKDKFASYDSIPDNPDDYASFDNYDDTQDEEYNNNADNEYYDTGDNTYDDEYYDTGDNTYDDEYYDEPQPVRQQRAQPYRNQQPQRRDPRYHDRRDQMYYDQQDNYDDRYGYDDRYNSGYDDGYGVPIEQPIMQPDPRAYNNPNYMGMAPGAAAGIGAGIGAAGAVGLNSDSNNDLDKTSEDKIDVGKKASSALAVIGVLTGLCALLGSCWKAALVGVTFFTTKSYSAIYAIGIPSTPMIAAIASFVCGMIVYATNPNSRSRKATTRMSVFSLIVCIALICVYVHTASYFD